jgi:molybdate transport system substrate-binding protein
LRYRSLVAVLGVLVSACVAASGAAAGAAKARGGVTVYAAASLTDVFPAIDRSNTYSFSGSNALAAQIANGAPADVFASANTSIAAQLFAQGLVERPVVFTRNTLVIVVPKSNPAGIKSIYDLTKPGVKIDVANAAVPVGDYTLQVLDRMGLRRRVAGNFVSQETDVRSVLSKVQLGQADAGFVYATDARTVRGHVAVIDLPERAQPKVAYSMAVVSRSPNKPAAQAFIREVLSNAGQAALRKSGFLPVGPPPPTITKLSLRKVKPGLHLTLIGTNLTGTTSVTFHGVPARFTVVSGTRLTVTVPKQARSGAITVTSHAGTTTGPRLTVVR